MEWIWIVHLMYRGFLFSSLKNLYKDCFWNRPSVYGVDCGRIDGNCALWLERPLEVDVGKAAIFRFCSHKALGVDYFS